MDFRERLLRNDIRHMSENLRALSEELMVIQHFVKYQFGTHFNAFLRIREKDDVSYTPVVVIPSSSLSSSKTKPRVPSFTKSTGISKPSRSTCSSYRTRIQQRERRVNRGPTVTLRKLNDSEENLIECHNQTQEDQEMFELPCDDNAFDQKHVVVEEDVTIDLDPYGSGKQDEQHDRDSNRIAYIEDDLGGNFESDDEDSDTVKTRRSSNIKRKRVTSRDKTNTSNTEKAVAEYDSTEENNSKFGDADSDSDYSEYDPIKGCVILGKQGKKGKKLHQENSKSKSTTAKKDESIIQGSNLCPVCEIEVQALEMLDHITNEHTEEDTDAKLVCRSCCKKNASLAIFEKHKVKCLEDVKETKCQYCGILFSHNYKRRLHERSHTGEKPHTCQLCKLEFSRKDNLRRHMRRTHKIQC